jgi:hypothetical protein
MMSLIILGLLQGQKGLASATKAGWRDVFLFSGYCTLQINSAVPCPRPKSETCPRPVLPQKQVEGMYFVFVATIPFKSIRPSPVLGRNWTLVPVLSKPSAGLCSCHRPGWFRNIHKYCGRNQTLVPVLFWPPRLNWLNWYSNVHQYFMQADH